jgi:hypothetical protein
VLAGIKPDFRINERRGQIPPFHSKLLAKAGVRPHPSQNFIRNEWLDPSSSLKTFYEQKGRADTIPHSTKKQPGFLRGYPLGYGNMLNLAGLAHAAGSGQRLTGGKPLKLERKARFFAPRGAKNAPKFGG